MFNNFSIRSRLILIISIMSALAVILTSVGLFGIHYSNSGLQTIYNERLIPVTQLKLTARFSVKSQCKYCFQLSRGKR